MTAPSAPANRAELIATIESSLWRGIPRLLHEIARAGSNLAEQQAACSRDARAILAALEAAGVRLVPVEATSRMLAGGLRDVSYGADSMWSAFVDASPYAPGGGA